MWETNGCQVSDIPRISGWWTSHWDWSTTPLFFVTLTYPFPRFQLTCSLRPSFLVLCYDVCFLFSITRLLRKKGKGKTSRQGLKNMKIFQPWYTPPPKIYNIAPWKMLQELGDGSGLPFFGEVNGDFSGDRTLRQLWPFTLILLEEMTFRCPPVGAGENLCGRCFWWLIWVFPEIGVGPPNHPF